MLVDSLLFFALSGSVSVTFRVEGSDVNSSGWLKVVGGDNSYLWGHSANGRNVIAGADEVWSVDLQLKFTQPFDNSL